MTEQEEGTTEESTADANTTDANTTDAKLATRNPIVRSVVLLGIGTAIAVGIVGVQYGFTFWQEQQRIRLHLGTGIEPVLFTAEDPPSPDNFDPMQVVPPFPPITEFAVVTLEEAESAKNKLGEDELVLGVVVNGEARAYPINMMTGPTREILNDTLGGRKIAATW